MEIPVTTERKDKASRVGLIAGIVSTLLWVVVLLVFLNRARLFPGGEDEHFLDFALIFGCTPYISIFTAIIAIIAGIQSMRRIRKSHQGEIRIPIIAIVLGSLGLLPFFAMMVAFIEPFIRG